MSSEEQSNKGPAPIAPPTYNISDMFRAEVGPMVKKMVDQLSQQMKDSASAEEEARQKLRSELFQEQQKLQKRVGSMLEEDTRKKPNGGFVEARDDADEISGEEEDFSFIQRQAARRVEPDEEDKKLWMETRRMSKEFSEDDWKKVKVTRLVDYYSGHAARCSRLWRQIRRLASVMTPRGRLRSIPRSWKVLLGPQLVH